MSRTPTNQNFKNMLITYAKWDGTNRFHAFDLGEGVPVTNIIYASCYSDYNLGKASKRLQEVAEENKSIRLVFQLRRDSGQKVMWQSV